MVFSKPMVSNKLLHWLWGLLLVSLWLVGFEFANIRMAIPLSIQKTEEKSDYQKCPLDQKKGYKT